MDAEVILGLGADAAVLVINRPSFYHLLTSIYFISAIVGPRQSSSPG
jgi:hypothetical protein